MNRIEMIDYIMEYSSDEFETVNDYINLAKLTDNELSKNIISIDSYCLNNN